MRQGSFVVLLQAQVSRFCVIYMNLSGKTYYRGKGLLIKIGYSFG